MSKIAFSSLQDAPALIRRLQNEMAQAVLLGESQDRLIRRIADVMQDGRRRARRIAQTEGTRVQSQARYNTLKDGAAMGINVARRWSTRMVNSRESHIALNGKTVGMDESFVTIAGNVLRYPGDPTAPAAEVINCYCVVVPVVGKRGESAADGLQSTGQNGTITVLTDKEATAEKDLRRQKTSSIKKSIVTLEKRIIQHEQKIAFPAEHDVEWDSATEKYRSGMLKHWEKEIDNFRKSITRRKDELKRRGE